MMTVEEAEELRQDMLLERTLIEDRSFFMEFMSNKYGDMLQHLKNDCKNYNHDMVEVIKELLDSV